MPCWEVNYMLVEFKAENLDLLKKSLGALKYRYSEHEKFIDVFNGRFTIHLDTHEVKFPTSSASMVNRLKQEYSWQALQMVASKKKWFLKTTAQNKGVIRRY